MIGIIEVYGSMLLRALGQTLLLTLLSLLFAMVIGMIFGLMNVGLQFIHDRHSSRSFCFIVAREYVYFVKMRKRCKILFIKKEPRF